MEASELDACASLLFNLPHHFLADPSFSKSSPNDERSGSRNRNDHNDPERQPPLPTAPHGCASDGEISTRKRLRASSSHLADPSLISR